MNKMKPLAIAVLTHLMASPVYANDLITDDSATVDEKIVVTGSRIARFGMETASPVVNIDADELAISGSMNVADVLATLPQFGPGIESSDNSYNGANAGIATADLRNLGSHRTLVLVNGHRPTQMADSSGKLVTDMRNIPASLIKNIEILTGGASAVYGSDAVAGVVNIILKKDFEGVDFNAQVSSTEEQDGETQSFSLSYGTNFNNDKGNFVFSVDYLNQEELTHASRPGSNGQTSYVPNPEDPNADENGIPNQIILHNVGWADYNITSDRPTFMSGSSYNYYQFQRNVDGSLGDGFLAVLDSELHEYYKQSHDVNPNLYSSVGPQQAIQPYDRVNVNLHGSYEFDNEIYLTSNISYSKVATEHTIDPEFLFSWDGWVNINDAPFNVPEQVIAAAESDNTQWIAIPYTFNDFGNRITDVDREYISASIGLEGDLDNGWMWDAYVSVGGTNVDITNKNRINSNRFDAFALIGECEASNSCPEMNPFNPLSDEVIDYLRLDPFTNSTDTFQYTLSGNLSGELYTLPAGDLMFSTGIEIRKEGLEVKPSQVSIDGLNHGGTVGATDVDRSIKELYVEFIAPIVTDTAFAKSLNIEAAYRYANYTYAGNNDSWKFGSNWAVDNNLRVRAVYSKTVRAPQLTELFRPVEVGFTRYIDPCDVEEVKFATDPTLRASNCAALGLPADFASEMRITGGSDITVQGNDKLDVETAYTLTAGIVFTPEAIENFNISLDYFDIDLEKGIAQFGALQTAEKCVDSNSIDNVFCPQVTRKSDGNISNINDTYVNANKMRRRGIDVQAYYLHNMDKYGEIDINLYATRLFESSFTESDLAGAEVEEWAGVDEDPKLRASAAINYRYNDLAIAWQTNYSESVLYDRNVTIDDYEKYKIPSSVLHNLRITYDINDNMDIYFGVNNVANKDWLGIPGASRGKYPYPITGRSFYTGINYRL